MKIGFTQILPDFRISFIIGFATQRDDHHRTSSNRAFLGLLVFLFLGVVLLLPAFLYSKRVKYKYYNGQMRRRIMARTHTLPTETERKQLASEQLNTILISSQKLKLLFVDRIDDIPIQLFG